jgi:hypothetical protein
MAQEFQEVVFRDAQGKETIRLSGQGADIFVRANAADANIVLQDQEGRETIRLSGQGADIFVRANAADANIVLQNQRGEETIRLSGNAGDLWLGGRLSLGGPLSLSNRGPNPQGRPGDLVATPEGQVYFCKGVIMQEGRRFLHWVNLTKGEDRWTEKT